LYTGSYLYVALDCRVPVALLIQPVVAPESHPAHDAIDRTLCTAISLVQRTNVSVGKDGAMFTPKSVVRS